jgi:hypothetical protein
LTRGERSETVSVLNRIAFFQNRHDEVPNQELARDLAASEDRVGIQEIAENLWNREPNVRSDCLKVLYEIGYLKPELVAPYAEDFLKLLTSRNNRLVWGAMIGLSSIAGLAADAIYPHVAEIQRAMAEGSVITVDAGVLTLARLAATGDERRAALLPYLLEHLRTCRSKDVPQHAEKIVAAITPAYRDRFVAVLQARMSLMAPAQAARLKKVMRQAEAL